MTALLRRIVDERLGPRPGPSKEEALSFVALGASGRRDTAAHHDRALDEAFRGGSLR
jgi:hypothetical protein